MLIKRINFYGAPGTGKTVLAHELFVHAKQNGRNCEIISELAREWAYVDRKIQGFDQLLLFAHQANREDVCLRNGKADFIITDSPVSMAVFYSLMKDDSLRSCYEGFTKVIDQTYPSINFFCTHNDSFEYHTGGRHHTLEESKDLSQSMLHYLNGYYDGNIYLLPVENRLERVIKIINNNIANTVRLIK